MANGTRVLVGEDSGTQRAVVVDALREAGLTPDAVADGRTALDLCRIIRPALVVLDIGLPALDGWSVLERIRTDGRIGATPVIMVTADDSEQTAARAFEAGATDFVAKPVRPAELIARVRRALRESGDRRDLLEHNQLLRQAAAIDALTGLPNRRASAEALMTAAARADSRGNPMTVALIDVDHFKAVNDTFGHTAGDRVLSALAGRLHDEAGPEQLVGRWGGEEFIVVLPEAGPGDARATCDRLRLAAAARPVNLGGRSITVTVSVGWASGLAADPQALVDLADAALYKAKEEGRNCVRAAA